MKCSLLKRPILLVMAMLCFSIGTLAQNMLLNMSNVTVKQAMNELKNKSGYSFVYSAGDIDTNRKVDIKAANVTDAINQILDGQDVAYEIQDKNIIVKKLVAQQKHSLRQPRGTLPQNAASRRACRWIPGSARRRRATTMRQKSTCARQ